MTLAQQRTPNPLAAISRARLVELELELEPEVDILLESNYSSTSSKSRINHHFRIEK
jgi:hypothetical protein